MKNRGLFIKYLTRQMDDEEKCSFILQLVSDKTFAAEFKAFKNSDDCKNFMKELIQFIKIVKEVSEKYFNEKNLIYRAHGRDYQSISHIHIGERIKYIIKKV